MKRVTSLLLAIVMVMCMMAGLCVSVGAEGEEYTYIEGASITGSPIPDLAVGDPLPALSYSASEGVPYAVTDCYWIDETGATVSAGTAVENGKVYQLRIKVTANEGYAFAHGYSLLINGEAYNSQPTNGRGEGFEYHLGIIEYPFLIPIDKVELTYTEPAVGAVLSAPEIPTEVNYVITFAQWYDRDNGAWLESGTVAEKGGEYELNVDLSPAVGYMFTEATEFWVNGQKISRSTTDYNYWGYWSDLYDLSESISKIEVTYAEPEVGKVLPMPVAKDAAYTISEQTAWYDYTISKYLETGVVAEKGHEYDLEIYVEPAVGYKFTEETALYVNSVQIQEYYVDSSGINYCTDIYDFTQEVTAVSVTCAEPEVGKAFPQAEVAADAVYEVYTYWYDVHNREYVEAGTVQDGGIYELQITVNPKPGYKFGEEVALTLNGSAVDEGDYYCEEYYLDYYADYSFAKPLDKVELSYSLPEVGKAPGTITVPEGANYTLGEETGWYNYATGEKVTDTFQDGVRYEMRADVISSFGYETVYGETQVYVNGEKTSSYTFSYNGLYITRSHSFAKSIDKVALPAWPELKVGDKLPEISGTGEHYSYYVSWEIVDKDGNYVDTDTVEDGLAYAATIYAEPEAGYEFTEDTDVTLGGKALSGWSYQDYDYLEDSTIYNFGAVKMIDKIELTTQIPGIGNKGGEVTVPEDAGYELAYAEWLVASDDTYEDVEIAKEAYQVGDRVLLTLAVETKEGYVISPDAVITINGKTYESVTENHYPDYVYVVYDLGELTKPAATPATGDTTPVMLLSLLCLSAAAGMGVLLNKKRAAR